MIFRKIGLEDIDIIRSYLEKGTSLLSDFTVGGLFMWRDFLKAQYAVEDGALFIKVIYPDDKASFCLPIGSDRLKNIKKVFEYCAKSGDSPRFFSVTNDELEWLESRFTVNDSVKDSVFFDYFYSADDLREFPGRKYHTQRNHINKFVTTHPEFCFETIDSGNIAEVADYYREHALKSEKSSFFAEEEEAKVKEVLANFQKYGFFGILLKTGKKTVGFSLGEKINDTLFVQIEKAEKDVPGAYQMIVREFARRYTDGKTVFINRGDDAGDEGLRQSKQSYHPIAMLEKNIVTLNIIQ